MENIKKNYLSIILLIENTIIIFKYNFISKKPFNDIRITNGIIIIMEKEKSKLNPHKSSIDSIVKKIESLNGIEKLQAEKVRDILLPLYKKWEETIAEKVDSILNSKEDNKKVSELFSEIASLSNSYKKEVIDFIKLEDIKNASQKKLDSSIGEELLSLIFKKIVQERSSEDKKVFLGSAKCVIGLFFDSKEGVQLDTKNVDFAIYEKQTMIGKSVNHLIVGLEQKTYVDKTMLDTANATFDKVKKFNPKAFYGLVAETLATTEIDLRNSPIGNHSYILRKQKRHDYDKKEQNPIFGDVLEKLYNDVQKALDNYQDQPEYLQNKNNENSDQLGSEENEEE